MLCTLFESTQITASKLLSLYCDKLQPDKLNKIQKTFTRNFDRVPSSNWVRHSPPPIVVRSPQSSNLKVPLISLIDTQYPQAEMKSNATAYRYTLQLPSGAGVGSVVCSQSISGAMPCSYVGFCKDQTTVHSCKCLVIH